MVIAKAALPGALAAVVAEVPRLVHRVLLELTAPAAAAAAEVTALAMLMLVPVVPAGREL